MFKKSRFFLKIVKHQQYGIQNRLSNRWTRREMSSWSTNKGVEDLSYFHHVGEQPLMYKTVGNCLQEAADQWPDRIYIKDCAKNETYTFSQTLLHADKLAASFILLGLNPGDTIGLCSPNSARWILSSLASARAGLISTLINPLYQKKELQYSINKVKVKCLLIPSISRNQKFYEMLCQISTELPKQDPMNLKLENMPSLKNIIILDDVKLPGTLTYKEVSCMTNTASAEWMSKLQRYISPDSGCNIQFTSGTTGYPKAALQSHFSNVNNSFLIGKRGHFGDKHNILCAQVPLFHAFGYVFVIQGCLQHGATIVLPSEWYNPQENIKAIVKEKCTLLGGTPTMHIDLLTNVKERQMKIDSLDLVVTGGASCSSQTFQQIKQVLGAKMVKSIFGMSETTAVNFMSLDNESEEDNTSTIGHVHDHIEVQVVDPEGKIVPFGTPGELCVRGYCTMMEYWGEPEKTKEMIGPDRWLKTGDRIILRRDGYGEVVGRIKDMINRGGENVFPKEIEDFLYTHPDIVECHVFGVRDERLGEEICAGVIIKEGSEFGYDELVQHCEGNISKFKIPKYLRILKQFPKTASGKIQKYKLREMFDAGVI